MFSLTPDGDNVNFLITGTCYEIHTGTAEVDDRVAEIQAIEGQWFVKSNDNNIMVADIEYMPLARNSRTVIYSSGYAHAAWEFPHHHRAPAVINGNVSLLYQSSNSRCYGTCLYGDYLFTLDKDSYFMRRIDITNGSMLSAYCPSTISYSFSVVDATHVVYMVGVQQFYLLDMETGDSSYIGSIPKYEDNYYHPHWAVIKDVLCVGAVREWDIYPAAPSWTKRQYDNYMFNIWTGQQLLGQTSLKYNADAYIYEYCMDVVANRDFFYIVQKTSENGGTWPEVVGPEPSIIYRLRAGAETYGGGESPESSPAYSVSFANLYFDPSAQYGDLNIDDLAYNPFNEMLYFVGGYWDGGSPSNHYSVVGMLSPENLSYSIIYSHLVPTSPTSQGLAEWFIPARNELYVLVKNGGFNGATIYNVRNWSPVAVIPYYSELLTAPFPNARANVVDVNNRLWYMGGAAINGDPTYLYALNLTTGVVEISIDTGIAEAWGDRYLYSTDVQYRQVIPTSNGILIFKHNTIQYAYLGRPYIADKSTQIYKVT